MKAKKMLPAMFSLVLTMAISPCVNSQTLTLGTDYTVTETELGTNSDIIGCINFIEPIEGIQFGPVSGYSLCLITYINTSGGKITINTEALSGVALPKKLWRNVVSLTFRRTGIASSDFPLLKGTKSPITINPYSAEDSVNIYNKGVTAGTAACSGTKTEVLQSEQISVYPNPTGGNLKIEVDNTILNANVSDLISGFYLIQILDLSGNLVKTLKLIKQ